MSRHFCFLAAGLLALAAALPAARADIITFNNLTGPEALQVSTYTEGNYTVTSSAGAWGEAHSFGNPVPSIFSTYPTASIDVTRTGGGIFTFNSVDLGNGGTGWANFMITGYLSGNPVFGLSSSVTNPNSFSTVPSYDPTIPMDTLRIQMSLNDIYTTRYNVDNINVGAIPEPGSLALLCTALVPALLRRRTREPKGS